MSTFPHLHPLVSIIGNQLTHISKPYDYVIKTLDHKVYEAEKLDDDDFAQLQIQLSAAAKRGRITYDEYNTIITKLKTLPGYPHVTRSGRVFGKGGKSKKFKKSKKSRKSRKSRKRGSKCRNHKKRASK